MPHKILRFMIRNLIIFFAVPFATFLSCQSPSGERQSDPQDSLADTDTATYRITEYFQTSPYYQTRGDRYDTAYFRAKYPLSKDTQFNALIMQSMAVKSRADLEHMGESFLADYDSYVEEAQQPELTHAWFQDIQSRVLLYTPKLLVISKTLIEYTGGAHGNYAELYDNYDVQTGKLLTLNDIVPTERQQEFIALAEARFRQVEGLAADAPLTERYFFDEGEFALPDNFAFNKDVLAFQYNPYEIKAYAEGVTQFHIPYDQLKDLLTDKARKFIEEIQQVHP